MTFAQFCFVAFEGLLYHIDFRSTGFLKQRQIPLLRWLLLVILFFITSVLNNTALGYQISIPVYIIFRSGGTVVTMIMGWLIVGKRYTPRQVLAIVVLTVGVLIATLSNAQSQKRDNASYQDFVFGICILLVSQLTASSLGLIIEATYRKYGSHWREGLFYTHFLALPFFIPLLPTFAVQLRHLVRSEPVVFWEPFNSIVGYLFGTVDPISPTSTPAVPIPRLIWYLILNMITQYVCVRGVNIIGASASALTLTIILNVRKFVSLILSMYIFKSHLTPGAMVGVFLVFGGAGWYSWESSRRSDARKNSK